MGALSFFRGLFGSSSRGQTETPEELRQAFRSRYQHFQQLLTANTNALEAMAEMEEALSGSQPFGMRFVRSRITRCSTQVYRIIQNLTAIAPGKYDALYEAFQGIQSKLAQIIDTRRSNAEGELVLFMDAADKTHADIIGAKMASLAEAGRALNRTIPQGFVITAAAYARFMEQDSLREEINRLIQALDPERIDEVFQLSTSIQNLVMNAPLPDDVEAAMHDAYAEIMRRDPGPVAVRSSALGEDMPGASFAGQYRTLLNVGERGLTSAYKEVVASKYTPQAMAYRLSKGIRDEDVAMCVGCLRMVNAVAGGVAYSRSPLNLAEDQVLVSSVFGLPRAVVDGTMPVDTFTIGRNPLRVENRDIPLKELQYVCYPEEGICREELSDGKAAEPSLTDEQVLEIAELTIALERYFGSAQDVEWAIDNNGRLTLLQCRPLALPPEEQQFETSTCALDAIICGGVTACRGGGSGTVCLVDKGMDALRFPDNGVLVVRTALPRWAALLPRTAALVAESGSLTGHLANVAREFGVPAIMGMAGVMGALTNGQEVTVDATARQIFPGRREESLDRPTRMKALMAGTPVHRTLKDAVEYITPLRLLDPDAQDFRPDNCRSLHDLTRFCHEKSVVEMFNFGHEHNFPERAAKQLYVGKAMQFWILNLDDGFVEDVQGKFVQLPQISCKPMLALWEGMVAKEWGGPPPVDTRGLMSIVFQSTMNPNLDPASATEYANRNYFLISRRYVSLQSRFGYHFCTCEALVGERDLENYIGFAFKGGAASLDRKILRVKFIAAFLEEYGFRITIHDDSLRARVEGLPEGPMLERLMVVGYVIMHTRQLDMVMADGQSAQQFAKRFHDDVRTILSKHNGGTQPIPETVT